MIPRPRSYYMEGDAIRVDRSVTAVARSKGPSYESDGIVTHADIQGLLHSSQKAEHHEITLRLEKAAESPKMKDDEDDKISDRMSAEKDISKTTKRENEEVKSYSDIPVMSLRPKWAEPCDPEERKNEKIIPFLGQRYRGASFAGRILIYGGNGFSGDDAVKHFAENNWWVVSVGFSVNKEAHKNILLSSKDACQEQKDSVDVELKGCMGADRFDAIICSAGGWCGGNAASDDLIRCHHFCWQSIVCPAIISSSIATKYLKDGGILILHGDRNALTSCPEMIGYSICKAAIHNLVISLGSQTSGLPVGAVAVAVLMSMIDTPRNRKAFPSDDFSTWTPVSFVTSKMYEWSCKKNVPKSGSLIIFDTKEGKTNIL